MSQKPSLSKLSNRQIGMVLAASALIALGVGSGIRILTSGAPDPALTPVSGATGEGGEAAIAFQTSPFVPSTSTLRLADPGLLKSTPQEVRLETVVAGRPDPFAPIVLPGPGALKRPAAAAPVAATAAPAPVQDLPLIPVAATQALPPLPTMMVPLPNLGPVAAAPTMPLSSDQPFAQPQSPVDRIEISGVAQIGDHVSLIVKEPGVMTSRYVRAGELIAGGQVRVKRIDLSNSEPVVVLEYNGQEFYRSVGSAALAGLF
ncbi:hypothetical protein [Pseudanabaena sp. FACHB-2040]|uniref:hypothetical protein n=1 Tax=Pseudanabaena sp. FACHB-2040 TaxID=2692859 RepID=UPI001683F880|nr:hypothetical protein [Pseudanabaena sp. FACHB-2040]MBD2260965.1 hypothetical protein [Pseudanabaena sp. FACHB-2040]